MNIQQPVHVFPPPNKIPVTSYNFFSVDFYSVIKEEYKNRV